MASLEDLTVDQLRARAAETESSHALLQSLTQNPKTREVIQRAIKSVNPNVVIPEIDAADSVRGEIKAEREERLKLERSIQERDIRDRLERQRAAIQVKYKLTADDMIEVEKIMTREVDPIPSYEGAAQVYKASRTSATPTPASFAPPTFDMPEKEIWGKGIGNRSNLNKIAMDEAFKAWGDIASGKVAGLGANKLN